MGGGPIGKTSTETLGAVMSGAQGSGCQRCPSRRPFAGVFLIPSARTPQVRGRQSFCSHHLPPCFPPPAHPLHHFRGTYTVYCWEYRGRVERGAAFTQDVSPKYFTLVQTSKLPFSFFSLSHSSFEAKSIARPNCLNVSWRWGGGAGGQKGAFGRKKIGHYVKSLSCCITVAGLGTIALLVSKHAICKSGRT